MKKIYQYLLIIFLWMAFFAGTLFAEDIYVTGITNITMRTGPGVEHKIVAMLKSGTKLEIVEYQKDWTHVKTDQGRTGWVLSRFLTQKVPDALLVEKLNKDNQDLMSKLEAIEDENKTLTVKNATLVQIQEKYNKLKQESSDFLKLDAKYKEMMQLYEAQKSQIETLENDLNNEPKLWFLIGPGVFIVGLFFGLSARKKKKTSLL
ncbi:MAG: TIGR04211 family SH3 domain-containing protein [Desulfobacula sp.]|uniref:TIGR04211 family SH3 domain-containing protein n=1 Tax=Desulfobacula sp. TaxID=2593537 RepID=UPI0025BD5351|nr:TIGR04211 family SH3 domain-containing protein [Desulfobacula sp.]MCD4719753.1 TIGR04211 family SH3 domain-containing protein [Desulfobacula sp.]